MNSSPTGTPSADARLVLSTLGHASLDRVEPGGTGTPLLERGKPLAVVAYLALAPDRTASRERLIDLLWAESDPEAARKGLRQTLWLIRGRLGDGAIGTRGDFVTLTAPIETDHAAFVTAAQAGACDDALARYRGDFLPEFATPGGAELDRWVDVERRRCRALFLHCAESLARQALGVGHAQAAVTLARRARDSDPHREAGWRLLLESLIAARDATGALLEAEALERTLAVDGATGEPSTRALLRAARRGGDGAQADTETPPGLAAELVGREREFATLLDAWQHARAGSFAHVHVVAPAGLGKTRLLTDLHARLRGARARVAMLHAAFGARTIAYALAADVAGALAALPGARGISRQGASVLVALSPASSSSFDVVPDPSTGEEALRRRLDTIAELLGAVCDEQPLALLVDDWHWADERSRVLLDALLSRAGHRRLLVVTAGRPQVAPAVATGPMAQLALAPLGVDAVGELVGSLAVLPDEPWADWFAEQLRRATGGSPLLVLETLHLALESGVLTRDAVGWHAPDAAALGTLLRAESALRHRVALLTADERHVALLLATHGAEIDAEALTRAAGEDRNGGVPLAALERRGLAIQHDGRWTLTHDEIASAVLDLAPADAVRAAHAALGRVLLAPARDATTDERALRTAAQHLVRAEDHAGLVRCLRLFVRAARASGDARSVRALTVDLLGPDDVPALTRALVREFPWTTRLWYDHRRSLAAAATLALAVASGATAAAWRGPPAPVPDAVLALVERDSTADELRVWDIPLFGDGWGSTRLLDVSTSRTPRWRLGSAVPPYLDDVTVGPHGWTSAEAAPDSQTVSLFERSVDGTRRRLTFARHSDINPSWAPDGSRLVFSTARWDPLSHYDIASYDSSTHAVSPLTSGDDSDFAPTWSPDGSRIAFVRKVWATAEMRLCTIDADGSHLECRAPAGIRLVGTLGWFDAQHILAHAKRGADNVLASIDVETGATRIVDDAMLGASVSPDGRWVLCQCIRRGLPDGTLVVYPTERPADYVPLRASLVASSSRHVWWAPGSPRPAFANRVIIDVGPGAATLGVGYQLRAHGVSRSDIPVALGVVRWRSGDTSMATIDSTGLLRPRRAGRVLVEASAGGWRRATSRVVVRPAEPRVLMQDDWTRGVGVTWQPFGLPRSSSGPDDAGRSALRNNGDGFFESGVVSRAAFSAREGLTLETTVVTPITLGQWQIQNVSLSAAPPLRATDPSDLRVGNLALVGAAQCGLMYPGGEEGAGFADSVALISQPLTIRLRASPDLRRGRPFRVRVDVLPDGRCAFAIDGRPLWVSPPAAFGDSLVVILSGRSVRTDVRIGPVELRSGASGEIGWDTRGPLAMVGAVPGRSARTP